MKKRLSAILLACGLSVSMLSGAAYAADSTEAAALTQAATEAQEVESELAEETGTTPESQTTVQPPRNVEGDRKYESLYTTLEQSIEQTLSQLSSLSDEQVAQLLESSDENQLHLIAAWDQAREQCGKFESVEYYDVEEDGSSIIFTDLVNYDKAAAEKSTVTVQVTIDMKSQGAATFTWSVKETIAKAMAQAGENTAVGLLNVFLVLFILTFVISMFRYIPNGSRKKKELEAAEAAAPAPVPAEEVPEEETSDDDEIAAVIAAAVAAYESETGSTVPADGFVVRSIRRRGRKSNWQNA